MEEFVFANWGEHDIIEEKLKRYRYEQLSYTIRAIIYDKGLLGYPKDINKAKELYEEGIKLDNSYAMVRLGILYGEGMLDVNDRDKEKGLYEMAEKLGNHMAMNNLGRMYEKGESGEIDLLKAEELYEKAIEYGSKYAINNLKSLKKKEAYNEIKIKELEKRIKELEEELEYYVKHDTFKFGGIGYKKAIDHVYSMFKK